MYRRDLREGEIDMPAHQIHQRGHRAFVGNVREIRFGDLHEQLRTQICRSARARRRIVDLADIGVDMRQ